MNIDRLKLDLEKDEGVRNHIYNDHLGKPTFGIGHLITKDDPEFGQVINTPVSKNRVKEVFEHDVKKYIDEARILFPNLDELPEDAQLVITNMIFNLGRPNLSKFKKFIAAVNNRDWDEAAIQMMDSLWARQVPNRAGPLRDRIQALTV